MAKTFESIGLTDEQFAEKLNASYDYLLNNAEYPVQDYPANLPPFEDHEVSDYNLVSESVRIRGYFNSGRTTATGHTTYASGTINTYRSFAKVEKLTGGGAVYPCLVRYELNYKFRTDETYTGEDKDTIMLFMCNRADGLSITTFPYADDVYHYQCNPRWYDNVWDSYSDQYLSTRGDRNAYNTFSTLLNTVTKLKQIYPFTNDYTAHLDALNNATSSTYVMDVNNPSRDQKFVCGIPCAYMDTGGYHYTSRIAQIPSWLPCFDGKDVSAIINYLRTGDTSGSYDPFHPEPEIPEIEEVTDFVSNFKTFITNKDNRGHVQFKTVCYNTEYIQGGDVVAGSCAMRCYERYFTSGGDPKPWLKVGQPATQAMYPTITLDHAFSTVQDGEMWEVLYTFESLVNEDEHGHALGGFGFSVRYIHDNNKENRVKIESVRVYPNFITQPTTFATCTWTQIVDGIKYSNSTYNAWHEIYFRAIGLDDLTDGYPDPDDEEDDTTGSDTTFTAGNGLKTYVISSAQFGTINNKMWSTDWTQLFKSNTIDPVRCVISCKGIPFTANPSALSHVVIANLDTGVDANTCTPVKSFDCGSYLMPSYRGDFTDITLTHVRVYLPFIGWCELPASEVMSRKAHSEVGISATPKRLGFKYIVDFIDGTCRCVISVNGSERWFFDGYCGIDIPVTSDNHTQAINNAIHSGVGAVISVASAVAGAVAENPMLVATGVTGAITNGANAIPTYSYSASSSPSGYINASMNTHIMIVIERPNVVESSTYAKKVGKPCCLSLNLGSLHGYTKCRDVDVSGINATPDELSMIKGLLESGVYL